MHESMWGGAIFIAKIKLYKSYKVQDWKRMTYELVLDPQGFLNRAKLFGEIG